MLQTILGKFPALPASLTTLIQLQPRDTSYFEKVLSACGSDPGVASEVIRLAHGAPACPSERITSVRSALLHVGPRPAVAHLLGGMLIRVFVPYQKVMKELWAHAVWTATAAACLAQDHAVPFRDPHTAHTAALLHDIGQLALACTDQVRYTSVLEEAMGDDALIRTLERRHYGADHAELGSHLAAAWGFSELIRHVIRYHDQVEPAPGPEDGMALVALIRLADGLHHMVARPRESECAKSAARALKFSVSEADLRAIAVRIEDLSRATSERLGLLNLEPLPLS